MNTFRQIRRGSLDSGQIGRSLEAAGSQIANRLARELESIEASLSAAERISSASAFATRPTRAEAGSDVSSRRAELELRERELQDWERRLERQRALLDLTREKLHRGRDSLKRAIRKFKAQSDRRDHQLNDREQTLLRLHSEVQQTRRDNAREHMRLKALARETFQDAPVAELVPTAAIDLSA